MWLHQQFTEFPKAPAVKNTKFPPDRFSLNRQYTLPLSLRTFLTCSVADDEALSTDASVINAFGVWDSVTGGATLVVTAAILADSVTRHI